MGSRDESNVLQNLSHKFFSMIEASIYLWIVSFSCFNVIGWKNVQPNNAVGLTCYFQFTSAVLAFIVALLYEYSCNHRDGRTMSTSIKRGQTHVQSFIITEKYCDDVDGKCNARNVGKWEKNNIHSMGVSFGSTVPALILFLPEIRSRVGSDGRISDLHLSPGLLYATLLASLGLSAFGLRSY